MKISGILIKIIIILIIAKMNQIDILLSRKKVLAASLSFINYNRRIAANTLSYVSRFPCRNVNLFLFSHNIIYDFNLYCQATCRRLKKKRRRS